MELEELIHINCIKLGLIARRETEIKKFDNSLNGVDHWITFCDSHILIQDKWKNHVGQQEMSQFLDCCSRIEKKFNIVCKKILISRTTPTAFSINSLLDKHAIIIIHDDMKTVVKLCMVQLINNFDLTNVKIDKYNIKFFEDLKDNSDVNQFKNCLNDDKFDYVRFMKYSYI